MKRILFLLVGILAGKQFGISNIVPNSKDLSITFNHNQTDYVLKIEKK